AVAVRAFFFFFARFAGHRADVGHVSVHDAAIGKRHGSRLADARELLLVGFHLQLHLLLGGGRAQHGLGCRASAAFVGRFFFSAFRAFSFFRFFFFLRGRAVLSFRAFLGICVFFRVRALFGFRRFFAVSGGRRVVAERYVNGRDAPRAV